jgi:glycosyltransferase involved in cell wall biosynthesis
VFSPHAWSFYHLSGTMRKAALAWERFGARWCDVILCGSTEEAQTGRELGIAGRYEVIANSSSIADPGLTRAQARTRLGLEVDDDAPLAVCLGRFTRQKGQDVMLAAWPAVASAVPGARLALAGQGTDEQMLRSMAPPDVIFGGIPHRDVAAVWMQAADVMVFPSRWETLSLAVLEALQLGRPVVVSDCGGMREALAGGAGAMVAVDDHVALADALIPFLADRDLAARTGDEARQAYLAVHEPQRQAKLAHYRGLLESISG